MPELEDADALTRMIQLDTVFRPGAPVDREDLFSGRGPERWSVLEAIRTPGQHAVIFGERGVGKSSLAAICAGLSVSDGRVALKIPCDSGDNFHSLWQKFVDECAIFLATYPDFDPSLASAMERAAEVFLHDEVGPSRVRVALRHVSTHRQLVVFFDEFDQVSDPASLVLFSNTIKTLSDQLEPVTLIPVGVGESLEELTKGHQSVKRSITQVRMPRMSRSELATIATRGFGQLEMEAEPRALAFIASVPRGLPQYAHMVAQEGARQALMHRTTGITTTHVLDGLRVGLSKVDHTLSSAYDEATYSARKTRFKEVLLACAVAEPDEHGYFAPADLRRAYSDIIEQDVDVDRFNPQLVQLSQDRGEILTRIGPERARRYRFTDPLMEPYVMLRGLDAGMITPEQVLGREAMAEEIAPIAQELPFGH
ncbi:MAG: AAA family ATPase [Microthrixaceae bacterium]